MINTKADNTQHSNFSVKSKYTRGFLNGKKKERKDSEFSQNQALINNSGFKEQSSEINSDENHDYINGMTHAMTNLYDSFIQIGNSRILVGSLSLRHVHSPRFHQLILTITYRGM